MDSRTKFDKFFRDLLGGKFEDMPVPKEVGKLDNLMPPEHPVYDYFYEVSESERMKVWGDLVVSALDT